MEVRELRKKLKMTQIQFARELGVSCMTVKRWEAGKTKPSPMAQKLLDEMFGVDKLT